MGAPMRSPPQPPRTYVCFRGEMWEVLKPPLRRGKGVSPASSTLFLPAFISGALMPCLLPCHHRPPSCPRLKTKQPEVAQPPWAPSALPQGAFLVEFRVATTQRK